LVLGIAVSCALISAIAVAMSVRDEARRYAWGWAVYFLVFSLVAAYSFWRIV
jgi:hypothetical protein